MLTQAIGACGGSRISGLCLHVPVEPSSEPPKRARATAALLRRRVATQPLWLSVRGTSMEPSILAGSEGQLVVGSRPRRGEVWAFCSEAGDLVVHRCRRFEDGPYG